MKYLLLVLLLFINSDNTKIVYICTGPYSTKYHKTAQCRGLKKCSAKIKQISLEDAVKKYKRKPCGYCY